MTVRGDEEVIQFLLRFLFTQVFRNEEFLCTKSQSFLLLVRRPRENDDLGA